MSHDDKVKKKIKEVVFDTAPDAELYLYGSKARGDSVKHSDWDILILLNTPNVSFAFETNFMDKFYEIEIETGEVISPLIYSRNDWENNHSATPLFENIKKDGIRII